MTARKDFLLILLYDSQLNTGPILITSQRFQRTPFITKHKPTYEERNRVVLNAHKRKRLVMAKYLDGKPDQWDLPRPPIEPTVLTKERKLPKLSEASPPYKKYSNEDIKNIENFETFYDPLFNPHLHEEKHKVDPDQEPFNAIYTDSQSEAANEYTKVRNITTPELWSYVERLARITIAPEPKRRKDGEPIVPMPSGFVPPPENPPDLPYFVPRTRNHILPVYYHMDSVPEKCYTMVKQVTGDLWQLEEDLRTHLQSIGHTDEKILSSVHETDARVLFRGKHLHQVVDWLHSQGF